MAAQLDAAAETLAATAEIPSGHRLAADEARAAGEDTVSHRTEGRPNGCEETLALRAARGPAVEC